MFSKRFKVKKREFDKKINTVFQHKLRLLMNCYTVRDIMVNEQEQFCRFKKSHKISGIKMMDPKEYTVKYEIEPAEDDDYIMLKIIV